MGSKFSTFKNSRDRVNNCEAGDLRTQASDFPSEVAKQTPVQAVLNTRVDIVSEEGSYIQTGDHNRQIAQFDQVQGNPEVSLEQIGNQIQQHVTFNFRIGDLTRAVKFQKETAQDIQIHIKISERTEQLTHSPSLHLEEEGLNYLQHKSGLHILCELEDTLDMSVENVKKGSIVIQLSPRSDNPVSSLDRVTAAVQDGSLETILRKLFMTENMANMVGSAEIEVDVDISVGYSLRKDAEEMFTDTDNVLSHTKESVVSLNHLAPCTSASRRKEDRLLDVSWLKLIVGLLTVLALILLVCFCWYIYMASTCLSETKTVTILSRNKTGYPILVIQDDRGLISRFEIDRSQLVVVPWNRRLEETANVERDFLGDPSGEKLVVTNCTKIVPDNMGVNRAGVSKETQAQKCAVFNTRQKIVLDKSRTYWSLLYATSLNFVQSKRNSIQST